MLNWFEGNFPAKDDLSSMEIRGHGTRIADICGKFLVRDRGLNRLHPFVVGSPGKDRQDLESTYDRQRKCKRRCANDRGFPGVYPPLIEMHISVSPALKWRFYCVKWKKEEMYKLQDKQDILICRRKYVL